MDLAPTPRHAHGKVANRKTLATKSGASELRRLGPVLPAARIQKHTVHHASAPCGQLKFVFHLHSCSQTHGYTTEPTPSHRNPMSSRKLERRGAYKTLWQSSLDIPLGEKLPMPLIFFIKARATDKTKGTPVCPELMTSHRDTSSPRSADTASLMLFLTVFE